MTPILECKDLKFSYPGKTILQNFNCKIMSGEKVSLLGASGCGKTSLLRLCAGLERPESGEIFLRGQLVSGPNTFLSPKKRNVGFVFQNFALFEKVSVEKNILYGCKTDQDRSEAHRLIELTGLKKHLNKKPHQLSGGEKQRVALARSLALKPEIVFLDEPFSSIDPDQTQFLIDEIKDLFVQLGVTALMVTHSLEESERFSDRVLKLNS